MTKGSTLCDGTFKNLLRCLPSFVFLCFKGNYVHTIHINIVCKFFSVLICLINDK